MHKAQEELAEDARPEGLTEKEGLLVKGTRIFVPDTARAEVLKEYHDSPLAGHPGSTKTVDLVRRRYWWPNIFADT